jgi:hypothetical protein
MVVRGAQEWMFCHVAPIRMPGSISLARCPVDSSAEKRVLTPAVESTSDDHFPTGMTKRVREYYQYRSAMIFMV